MMCPALDIELRNFPFLDGYASPRWAEAAECAALHGDPGYPGRAFDRIAQEGPRATDLNLLYQGESPDLMRTCIAA